MSKYTKDELIDLIFNKKLSYEKIGKMYGISGSAIKKAALRFGLVLDRKRKINENETFNKGKSSIKYGNACCINCEKSFVKYQSKNNKFCSIRCQHEYQHKEKYERFLSGDEYFQRANYSCDIFKPEIMKDQNHSCLICGCKDEWNGKKLVFILDHIDGNAANNKRDNLRLVCPNCDSQLDTYKSKNKNSARIKRYK